MRSVFGLLPVVSILAVIIVLCGCGGGEFASTERSAGLSADSSSVTFAPAGPGIMLRDIADKDYESTWIGGYSYADAQVSASFVTPAKKLEITFTGSGLKPNFAYQFKLEGLPLADPVANQTLGDLGRWWGELGYLIFGYMVTATNRSATTRRPR